MQFTLNSKTQLHYMNDCTKCLEKEKVLTHVNLRRYVFKALDGSSLAQAIQWLLAPLLPPLQTWIIIARAIVIRNGHVLDQVASMLACCLRVDLVHAVTGPKASSHLRKVRFQTESTA